MQKKFSQRANIAALIKSIRATIGTISAAASCSKVQQSFISVSTFKLNQNLNPKPCPKKRGFFIACNLNPKAKQRAALKARISPAGSKESPRPKPGPRNRTKGRGSLGNDSRAQGEALGFMREAWGMQSRYLNDA